MIQPKGGQAWRFRDRAVDPYVQEHVDLINAIVKGGDLNEAKQVTDSTLTAIMGREAAYSGAGVDWETIANSKFTYGPELLYTDAAKMTFGDFRVLRPPMPKAFNILKEPPVAPTANV
jgi:hypothetical protein